MSNKLYRDLSRIANKYKTDLDIVLSLALHVVKTTALVPGESKENLFSFLDTRSNCAYIYTKKAIVDSVVNPGVEITKEEAEAKEMKTDDEGAFALEEFDPKRIAKLFSFIDSETMEREIKNRAFFTAVEALAKEKDIDPQFIFEQFSQSIVKAAKRQDAEARKQLEAKRRADFRKKCMEAATIAIENGEDPDAVVEALEAERAAEEEKEEEENIFCDINNESRTVRIYRRMKIVDSVEDPKREMTAEQAARYGKEITDGCIEIEFDPKNMGRLFAMNVKGIIRQAISEEERRRYRKDVLDKDKEVVSATVQYIDEETLDARIDIGKNAFTLKREDQLPGEQLKIGQIIKVYVSVIQSETDSERSFANISRRDPGLVKRLFEMEVTEISDGTVEIVSVSREAGSRTKIAVSSTNPDVDPVGACIGTRGQRVNTIIEALGGEKIDIIHYSDDPVTYIAAALAPSKVTSVEIEPESAGAKRTCHVVVPQEQLSLAIGNKGQNVRLAAKLTGWKIDIKTQEDAQEKAD